MDAVYNILLFFENAEFIILLMVLGIYFGQRMVFLNTLVIFLFGFVLNAYLKSIFQVPLNPELGKLGWAYPSGHAMFDVIFWGSLFIQVRKPWVLFVGLAIVVSCSFGMVHKRYHNWEEIFGGICSGGLVLVAFYYWMRYQAAKIMTLAVSTLIISLCIYWFLLPHKLMKYEWTELIIGLHIGLCLALFYIERVMPHRLYAKAVAFSIAIVWVYSMYTISHMHEFIIGAAISSCALMLIPGGVKYIERNLPTKYHSV